MICINHLKCKIDILLYNLYHKFLQAYKHLHTDITQYRYISDLETEQKLKSNFIT